MDSLDQCIVNACKNSWDKSYLAGTPNKDNCSGFVQSVAAELGVPMPRGNANAMVDGLEQSWTKLASGAEAAQKAAQGFLVIAGLKGRTYGHVAVVISGPLYRQKYPMCWCGSIAANEPDSFAARFPTSIPTPLARPFAARLRTPTSAFRPYTATKRRQGFFRPANEHPST